MKFGHKKTTDSTLLYVKNPKSLSHLGLNWYRVVTVRHQDGRTDEENYNS